MDDYREGCSDLELDNDKLVEDISALKQAIASLQCLHFSFRTPAIEF